MSQGPTTSEIEAAIAASGTQDGARSGGGSCPRGGGRDHGRPLMSSEPENTEEGKASS